MKKGLKVRFWTPSEDQMLRTCIAKFKSGNAAATWAAPKLGRTAASVQQRISFLTYNLNPTYRKPREQKQPVVKVKNNEQKGVTIPQGFTFDIKPNRAVMYSDHVRLYF
jgi:hypothetical protein